MKRATTVTAVLVFFAAAVCFAADEQPERIRITLKEQALLSGDVIRISDIAEIDGDSDVRALSLGNTPWPGHARRVTRALIEVRLLSCGYDLERFELAGADHCMVELNSVRIEPERIIEAAHRHLAAQFPEGGPEVAIELVDEVAPVLVPAGEQPVELRASLFGSGQPVGRVRVEVDILRAAARLRRVTVGFTVQLFDRVAVARRSVERGESLSPRDVEFVRREIGLVQGACVRSADELAGCVAKRDLYPGQAVTRGMIEEKEAPVVIEYGQRVYLVVQTDTLRVVTLGKALCRARLGEPARAENLKTGREVVGLAEKDGTIRIQLEGSNHVN